MIFYYLFNLQMTYIIAIPTYQRTEDITKKTLSVLKKYKIPKKKIYIFVANQTEKESYTKVLKNNYQIIIGKLGLGNQRNFIRNYFPEKTKIVSMDDDIEEINYLVNPSDDLDPFNDQRIVDKRLQIKKSKHKRKSRNDGKTKVKKDKSRKHENPTYRKRNILKNIPNLDIMIRKAFDIIEKKKLNFWGVYPINNPYFMSNRITTDLKLITGPFFGYINQHNANLKNTLDEKEDVERSIQYYLQDNGILRLNNFSVKTSYYRNSGGMQAHKVDRKVEALKSAKYLAKKYPQLTELYLEKKSGYAEVKLKDKRK